VDKYFTKHLPTPVLLLSLLPEFIKQPKCLHHTWTVKAHRNHHSGRKVVICLNNVMLGWHDCSFIVYFSAKW